MAVRERSGGFQVDFSTGGKRIRKDGFKSKKEAELWELEAKARVAKGEVADPDCPSDDECSTLKQLLDKVYALHWAGQKSEDTALKNAQDCVDYLGEGRALADVTTGAIDGMVKAFMDKKLSNATINRKLAALSKMLKFAQQRGWVKTTPHIARRKESEHRLRWVTEEEEAKMLQWFNLRGKGEFADLFAFLLDTGLRLAEAVGSDDGKQPGLAWANVRKGWVDVKVSKNGKPRSIPMTPRVCAILTNRRKAAPKDMEKVWHDTDYWSVEYHWRAMRESLGLDHDEQFVVHILRHTFCSRLVQRGVRLEVVKELAGHKDLKTTMRYAHLCPTNLVEAVAVLAPELEEVKA